jgi:hypothetical protein
MADDELSKNMANGGLLNGNDNLFQPSYRQKELCRRLDKFYKIALKREGFPPSELFRGALYTMRPMHRKQNPDWMAQVAHSLRDILYPFYRSGAIVKGKGAFIQYGSAGNIGQLDKAIGQYFGFLSEVAHHNLSAAATNPIINGSKKNPVLITEELFENVVTGFEGVLFEALRRQIDAHKEIDEYIRKEIEDSEALQKLLNINYDARRYFYSKAHIKWLDWLWENGFLDVIKEKSEDPTRYSYRSPELDYLAKVATTVPERAVDFMLTVTISSQRFNPEVVDRFLGICQSLPAEQLARIVPKIRDEKWVLLMAKFSHWGFEYEKMMEILANAKDYSSLLILAEAILEVRTKEDISKEGLEIIPDNPFYFSDLRETKVFEHLVGVEDAYVEPALALATRTMGNIVCLGETEKNNIFDIKDKYFLFNVDFFTIEMGDEWNISYRDEICALAAVIKTLLQRSIGSKCADADAAKLLYETHIKSLPNSQSVWRLKLFAISLCPDVFRDELRAAFFRIFDYEEPWPLIRGAEYEWALKKGFSTLSAEDREVYISRVLSYFGDEDKEAWQKNSGWCLLSSAFASLTDKEKVQAREVFGRELDLNYQPKPSIGDFKFGFVSPKAPIRQEVLSQMSISEIVEKLKKDWAPEQLRKQDREQDFLKPLNAEGMSNVLKADIVNRIKDYISNAFLFFDRDHLDSHYTYTFLLSVFDVLREKKYPANTDWSGLFKLFAKIVDSAKVREFIPGEFEQEISDTWLVGWDGVHKVMADVLQELLKGNGDQPVIDFSSCRSVLLEILYYLLEYPDPEPETELKKVDTIERDPQTGAERHTGSDPFTAAINSVRGRAFQVFVHFTEKDGLSLQKNAVSKLSADVKKLYQKCLDAERTQAVMFLFGHYLAFFYYRDRDWISGIVPQIFPDDPVKKDLYLAAWEGYLVGTLYKELFEELSDYYRRAIILDPAQYTPRRYFKDLDEGLATHIALVFSHFSNFDFNSSLFKLFWKMKNSKRHKEFISFTGRSCVSRDNAKKWIETHNIDIEKLKQFWDWGLENCPDPEVLAGFSFWIEAKRNVFDPVWLCEHVRMTLEKTGGIVEWDYGMMQSLAIMADSAPEDTLKILKLYLLGTKGLSSRRPWLYVDDELMGIFKTLYNNPVTKEGTYSLIDELLPIGRGQFWKLKDIINEK